MRALACATVMWTALLAAPALAVISNVDEANDVCAPTADPCVVTDTLETVDGAVLDFGAREVQILGGGQIDAGTGDVTLLCGELTISRSGTAVKLNGPDGFGSSEGGTGIFRARRRCSGDTGILCLNDNACAASAAGTCSVGSGDVLIDGKIVATAGEPGSIFVRAAGDIRVDSTITADGTLLDADAGEIELFAAGSVTVNAKLQATSGWEGTGGDLYLDAGGDLTMTDVVDLTGGDFDGGIADFTAGGNVLITNDINVNATAGEGFGGEIAIDSDGDLVIDGGGASNRLTLTSDGHGSSENFGGDGGSQDYTADGDLHFGRFVKVTSDGAFPDGFGDAVFLDAGGDLYVEADVQARSEGAAGGGGDIEFLAGRHLTVTSDSRLDVDGGDSGAGTIILSANENLAYHGTMDLTAGNGGQGGDVEIDSGGEISISGTVVVNGAETATAFASIEIFGCQVSVLSGALIDNRLDNGITEIFSREQTIINAGSTLQSGAQGENRLIYRSNAKPPIVNGSVSPAANLVLEPLLQPCPVCGNGEVDDGETCDDGGVSGGDGCSADCQDEGCIADTPGYPSVSLCDDGNDCSVDSCNAATSSCEHSTSCDDGIDCTIDSCSGTDCIHTPEDSLCDDGDTCSQDVCSAGSGCSALPTTGPCDDGLFCNGQDSCGGGSCSVHTGNPCAGQPECQDVCDEGGQTCGAPFGTPCTDDGNICTNNVCDGAGTCIGIANSSPCDDGIFCNGNDICTGGACSFHAGSPCVFGQECANVCDEGARACQSPALQPCTDDENPCTDDYCDGGGSCIHVDNTAPCEDGDFCTVDDQCSAGSCTPGAVEPFSSVALSIKPKPGVADDQIRIKAVQPLDSLTSFPSDTGMRLQIRDDQGLPGYESIMPAGEIVNVGGKGKKFKFKDPKNLVAEANAMRVVIVKRDARKGIVRIKAKVKGTDVAALTGRPYVSMSLLFGQDPSIEDCVSGSEIACEPKGRKFGCEK